MSPAASAVHVCTGVIDMQTSAFDVGVIHRAFYSREWCKGTDSLGLKSAALNHGRIAAAGGLVERVVLKNALIRLDKKNYFANFIYQTLLMLKAQSSSNGSEHTHVY